MSAKKRGLGKGLGALLGDMSLSSESELDSSLESEVAIEETGSSFDDLAMAQIGMESADGDRLQVMPIEYLQTGRYQPRTHINEEHLKELAESISQQGIVQPIVIRKLSENRYEIIAGERRWRAAQLIGLHEVPVIIKVLSDQDTLAIALIENIQREDLNVIEEAEAYFRLADEFGATHQQIAEIVGKSRATITNILRLIDLHQTVKDYLQNNQIDMGHARALLVLEPEDQLKLAKQVIEQKLNVRATEKLVKNHGVIEPVKSPKKAEKDPDLQILETRLSEKFGTKTEIQQAGDGKGRLVINFHDLDQLQGVLSVIGAD